MACHLFLTMCAESMIATDAQDDYIKEAKKTGKYNEQGIIKASCTAIDFVRKDVSRCHLSRCHLEEQGQGSSHVWARRAMESVWFAMALQPHLGPLPTIPRAIHLY